MKIFAKVTVALFLAFFATSANAASRAWISECRNLGVSGDNVPAQVCALPFLANSGPIDISDSVAHNYTVGANTRLVRICAEVQLVVKGAITAVANTDAPLFAGTCEYFGVQPSSSVSVIVAP